MFLNTELKSKRSTKLAAHAVPVVVVVPIVRFQETESMPVPLMVKRP